jgi:molybdenum cofactor cytidylyltransferase
VAETAVRAVILAAGSSSRTAPVQKLLARFRGRPLIEYAIEAALPWDPVVVAAPEVARGLRGRSDCTVLLNERPERGMSYSLKIADCAIGSDASLLVFLADKPLVSQIILERVCTQRAQVAFPLHAAHGTPGHPVFFDVTVRPRIAALPDGDTLHRLRDDPSFVRSAVPVIDEGAFFDVDEVTALDAAVSR